MDRRRHVVAPWINSNPRSTFVAGAFEEISRAAVSPIATRCQ
jgi:hypothetical protein